MHFWHYSLCSVDISALVLALGPRHDVLVPVQQPVVPVAVLVDADISLVQSEGVMIMNNTSYIISSQPPWVVGCGVVVVVVVLRGTLEVVCVVVVVVVVVVLRGTLDVVCVVVVVVVVVVLRGTLEVVWVVVVVVVVD